MNFTKSVKMTAKIFSAIKLSGLCGSGVSLGSGLFAKHLKGELGKNS